MDLGPVWTGERCHELPWAHAAIGRPGCPKADKARELPPPSLAANRDWSPNKATSVV